MAEIHALPVRLDQEGARRLFAALMEAYAGGVDLGPRGPQIYVLARSLEKQLQVLRSEIDYLTNALDQTDPGVAMLKGAVGQLIAEVNGMIVLGQAQNP